MGARQTRPVAGAAFPGPSGVTGAARGDRHPRRSETGALAGGPGHQLGSALGAGGNPSGNREFATGRTPGSAFRVGSSFSGADLQRIGRSPLAEAPVRATRPAA